MELDYSETENFKIIDKIWDSMDFYHSLALCFSYLPYIIDSVSPAMHWWLQISTEFYPPQWPPHVGAMPAGGVVLQELRALGAQARRTRRAGYGGFWNASIEDWLKFDFCCASSSQSLTLFYFPYHYWNKALLCFNTITKLVWKHCDWWRPSFTPKNQYTLPIRWIS